MEPKEAIDFKKAIKIILKEAGVAKPTKIVNEIMSEFNDSVGVVATVNEEETEVDEKEGAMAGLHRNPSDYIHKIGSDKDKRRGVVTSIEIPNTDRIVEQDLSK